MMKTDDELAAFVATWNAKLRRFQRAHPARWHVRGWSDDEVRDAITLRLIESHAEVTTEEVAWSVARARLAELRRAQ